MQGIVLSSLSRDSWSVVNFRTRNFDSEGEKQQPTGTYSQMGSETIHNLPGSICPSIKSYRLNKHIECLFSAQHSARLKRSHTEQAPCSL